MAETKATNGAKSAEERKQAREPEMELIREAQRVRGQPSTRWCGSMSSRFCGWR